MATRSTKSATTTTPETEAVVEAIDFSAMTVPQRLDRARELLGGGVGKGGHNKDQDYDYVRAGDVSRLVYGAFSRVGLYAVPTYTPLETQPVHWVTSRGTNQWMAMLKVELRIGKVESKFGTDEILVITTIGYGADTGDKGPYKAMTGGLKYALLHAVGLSTDDDPENARGTEPAAAPAEPRRVGPQPASAPTEAAPTTPVGEDPNAPITTNQSRLLFAKANEAGLDTHQFRSLVFMVTGKRKSSDLVSKEVDEILTGLADEAILARAKSGADQDAKFDATVGQAPDPTKDAQAEADRIAAEAAALTGGTVVEG